MPSIESAVFESYMQFDARLVEEAVLLSIAGHPEERQFRKLRDRIYEIEDAEQRERQFQECHAEWFQLLGLNRPLRIAFEENPPLREKTRMCAVTLALSSHDEGADLYTRAERPGETDSPKPSIAIKLRPKTLLNTAILLPLLRHELMHVSDMLEPGFGYEPVLPKSEFGSTYDNLVRERYKILWDTWIDGRLQRRNLQGPVSREKRLHQFLQAFPALGPGAEQVFNKLYESPVQTHRAFMERAQNPDTMFLPLQDKTPRAGRCPLCRFPAYHFAAGAELPSATLKQIQADYPQWRAEEGLCVQCADLYRARSVPM